jgi:fused signal recognition particle receptor
MASFTERLKQGLSRTRASINELFYMGGEVDEEYWERLEDALVMADCGANVAMSVADDLREQSARENLTTADAITTALAKSLATYFPAVETDPFRDTPSCVLFVGINGAGKTTTVGKLAARAKGEGKNVIIGGADTFRAAAIEQLDVWADRAGIPMVTRERGADPASVCYDVIEQGEKTGCELALIDTAGRLHTSPELMRELAKVVNVTRKRSQAPVYVVLVVDATTGQNGLAQAKEFNDALDVDGLIVTKLDGTAKGGITVAIADQLGLPIYRIGVGESIEDLESFDSLEFCRALVGDLS